MTQGLRSIRPLAKESLRGVDPAVFGKGRPKFEWVDPRSLYVEEIYQRSIAERGTALIRKIYSGFSWSRFKPPICVRLSDTGGALVCIDGQHTATACASHPAIDKIPVMIVDAADVAKRAQAFVGHNKDRLALTTVAIYLAELAARDPLAVMVDEACREAGATIARTQIGTNIKHKHPVGITVSIGAIRTIAKQQGKEALVRVLKLLVAAKRGPIKSIEIAAVALIFAYHHGINDDKLLRIIALKSCEQWTADAYKESAKTEMALALSLAWIWCARLGVRAPHLKQKGNNTDHARLISKRQDPEPEAAPPAAPAPAPASKINIEPAPAELPTAVERNGVKLDIGRRRLTCKRETIELSEHEAGALSILVKVMPAIMSNDHIAIKAFGNTVDATFRVRKLADALQPRLGAIGLELKEVPKMGFALRGVT